MKQFDMREWKTKILKENTTDELESKLAEFESKLAGIADVINQELRENGGDRYQIQNYLHTDFRPIIRKLVDLCKK